MNKKEKEKDYIRLGQLRTKYIRWFLMSCLVMIVNSIILIFFSKSVSQDVQFGILVVWLVLYLTSKVYDTKHSRLQNKITLEHLSDMYDQFFKNTINDLKESTNGLTDSYKLLKITPKDSNQSIKNRYKELAQKWHPDKWVNDTIENKEIAERNFKRLVNAYDVLKKHRGIK